MGAYAAVKNRILSLCYEKRITVNQLATNSGVSRSTIKSILYGKSQNPGIVTLKLLCDGLDISLTEFFDTEEFRSLEQEME